MPNFFDQFDDESTYQPVDSATSQPVDETDVPLSDEDRALYQQAAQQQQQPADTGFFGQYDEAPVDDNFFSQYDDESTFQVVEDLPETEPQEAGMLSNVGNLARGTMDRISDLVGGLVTGAGTFGQSMEERFPLPGILWGDEEGLRFASGEEYRRVMEERKGTLAPQGLSEFLEDFGQAAVDVDFDYEAMNTWEDVKDAEGAVDTITTAVKYGLEQGWVSLPDMAAILLNMPAYMVARSGEIAHTRAQTDRRDDITESDLAVGAGTSLVVSALERFGAERVLGAVTSLSQTAFRRIITAMAAETITEGLQESAEYVGERVGQVEMSLAEGFDRALAGMVGGGIAGGAIRGTLEAGAAITGTDLGFKPGDAPEVPQETRNAALDAVVAAQEAAERRVAEGGGDLLDQALAGADAAAVVGQEAQTELEAQQTALEEQQAAKEAAFEQAEQEAAAQKEAEVQEAQYQQEVQRGVETQAIETAREAGQIAEPTGTTLGEIAPELATLKQKPKAKEPAKPKEPEEAPKLIEDMRPIVVAPDGTATTAQQLDAQIREQLTAQDVEADVNTTAEGQVEPIPVTVSGLDIQIENPKGSQRNGRTLKDHYGEIPAVQGADGDAVDVFLGSEAPTSQQVYVVDQLKEDGSFDEHKVMVGYANEMAARRAYRRNYDKNWKMGPVTEMTMDELKTWLDEGGVKKGPMAAEATTPDVTIASEEDLALMQTREEFKGGKRPKILYRLEDSEVAVKEVDTGATKGFALEASVDGERVGGMLVQERGENYQVHSTGVEASQRGKQHGQRLILEAARYAMQRGRDLVSDTVVSVKQLRAYEALRKKGLLVVEYENEAEVQRALAEESEGFSVTETPRPVVKRMFTPEFTEDIRYRDSITAEPSDMAPATAEAELEPLLDELSGLNVELLASPEDAPAAIREQMESDGRTGAKGLYDVASGRLFVFTENHRTMDDVVRTILHEGVAHKGLRMLLGDRLPKVLEDIWEGGNQNAIRQVAERYGLDVNDRVERAIAVEEYVAALAERSPEATVLEQIKGLIRQFLRELGMLDSWTEGDINSLLRDARSYVRGKPLNKIELVEQAEIEETGEVVDIVETADVMMREMNRRQNIAEKLRACVNG